MAGEYKQAGFEMMKSPALLSFLERRLDEITKARGITLKKLPPEQTTDTDHKTFFKLENKSGKTIYIAGHPFVSAELPSLIKIKERLCGNEAEMLAAVQGTGISENHNVMFHFNGEDTNIFDSKRIDLDSFFTYGHSQQGKPGIGQQIMSAIKAGLKSLLPSFRETYTHRSVPWVEEGETSTETVTQCDYDSVGDQSLFDTVSCPILVYCHILSALELILDGEPVNVEGLRSRSINVYDSFYAFAEQDETCRQENVTNIVYKEFIQQAWNECYSVKDGEDRFANYFLGWPKSQTLTARAIYFVSLGFITNPLVSLVKLPTEFALSAIAATFDYLRDKSKTFDRNAPWKQYLNTGLQLSGSALYGLAKGASLLVRTVTSPLTSFKEGWNKHPALGITSALLSTVAFAAITVLAAPALISAFPAVASTLAAPVMAVFSQVPAAAAVGATAITGLGALKLFERGSLALEEHLLNVDEEKPQPTGFSHKDEESDSDISDFDKTISVPAGVNSSFGQTQVIQQDEEKPQPTGGTAIKLREPTSRGLSAGSMNPSTSLDPAGKPRDVGEDDEFSGFEIIDSEPTQAASSSGVEAKKKMKINLASSRATLWALKDAPGKLRSLEEMEGTPQTKP